MCKTLALQLTSSYFHLRQGAGLFSTCRINTTSSASSSRWRLMRRRNTCTTAFRIWVKIRSEMLQQACLRTSWTSWWSRFSNVATTSLLTTFLQVSVLLCSWLKKTVVLLEQCDRIVGNFHKLRRWNSNNMKLVCSHLVKKLPFLWLHTSAKSKNRCW